MIDKNFIVNLGVKEPSKSAAKSYETNTTKNSDFKNNDFKKILNDKTEKVTYENANSNESLENKEPINSDVNKEINESKVTDESKFENAIKEVVEVIKDNFQGNKIEDNVLEQVVALLNQILNSPELKSLMPVKLEDPMYVASGNVDVINIGQNNSLLKDKNLESISSLLNTINAKIEGLNLIDTNLGKESLNLKDINMSKETLNLKDSNLSKEALNLANTILETLNSKNVNGVLSENQVQGLEEALEVLVKNIFKSDTSLLNKIDVIPEIVKDQGLATNVGIVAKEDKSIKINNKIDNFTSDNIDDSISGEVKSILSQLKLTTNTERTSEIEVSQISNNIYVEKSGATLDSIGEKEDKLLAKILGENESASINRQATVINRLDVKPGDIIKEPMVVNKETMDKDVIKNVNFMIKNEVSELKVKIYPKELGEMTIKLLSEEGILKADIRATSKETYNLLHSNLNDIKKSLEQQNIKIYEVNIGLYSDDTTYYSGENNKDEMFKNNENNQGRQGKNSSRESALLTDDSEEIRNLYEDSSVDILA